jgi:hypothetical protein
MGDTGDELSKACDRAAPRYTQAPAPPVRPARVVVVFGGQALLRRTAPRVQGRLSP